MDDYDYDEADLKLERSLMRRITRQRIEHWGQGGRRRFF